jgi:hypothetical protein
MKNENIGKQSDNTVELKGFVTISGEEKLLRDSRKTGIEKLQLFTKMIRRNAMFNRASLITKPK